MIEEKLNKYNLKKDEMLKKYTSFKIGGKADYFVEPRTKDEILEILKIAREENLPSFILGNGTNLLISDKGIRGIVIHLGKNYQDYKIDATNIIVQSGMSNKTLANILMENSLKGYEFASGIPGTVGGASVMNAGAYDYSCSEFIKMVHLVDRDGKIYHLKKDEMEYEHRNSIALKNNLVAIEVEFEFEKGDKDEIKKKIDDYKRRREEKQPLDDLSAGSAFKRPKGNYASKLIQESGLKGFSLGNVQVSPKHAGFIINKGDATCEEVIEMLDYIKKTVKEKSGYTLEEEIRIVGDFS